MTNERDFIEVGFRYVDQFGNETKTDKKIGLEFADITADGIIEEFRSFLIYAGYTFLTDKNIIIEDAES